MPGIGELIVILMILVTLPLFGLWVWMIVDCATNEPPQGNDKVVWILVIVLGSWIGALIYLFARRPKRKAQYGR
jgi:fructose-specific phosphotransferase system IIC component